MARWSGLRFCGCQSGLNFAAGSRPGLCAGAAAAFFAAAFSSASSAVTSLLLSFWTSLDNRSFS